MKMQLLATMFAFVAGCATVEPAEENNIDVADDIVSVPRADEADSCTQECMYVTINNFSFYTWATLSSNGCADGWYCSVPNRGTCDGSSKGNQVTGTCVESRGNPTDTSTATALD